MDMCFVALGQRGDVARPLNGAAYAAEEICGGTVWAVEPKNGSEPAPWGEPTCASTVQEYV